MQTSWWLAGLLFGVFASAGWTGEDNQPFRCDFSAALVAHGPDRFPANCVNNYQWGNKEMRIDVVKEKSGNDALCIDIRSISSGAMQFFVTGFSVWRTKWYRVSFRMKSEGFSSNVRAQVRKIPQPWTRYLDGISIRPTEEWTTYSFSAKSAGDCDNAMGVMFETGGVGKLWIDDITVQAFDNDPDEARQARVPVAGNLLSRSSFEGLTDYYWCSMVSPQGRAPDTYFEDPQAYREVGGKFGRYCMALPASTVEGIAILRSYKVPVCPGAKYTLSFWARNVTPGSEVVAQLFRGQQGLGGGRFKLTPEWKQYRAEMTIKDGVEEAFVSFAVPAQSGVTLFDGVSFALTEMSADYKPAYPYELSLSTPQKRGNLFYWGEEIPLTMYCASATGASDRSTIRAVLRVTAYPDIVLQNQPVTLPVDKETSYTLKSARNGLLRVELIPEESKLAAAQELLPAVLPVPRDTGAESSFGTHITINPFFVNYARRTGFKWIRLHDAGVLGKWKQTQTVPGEYRWYDQSVDLARSAGLHMLGLPDDAPLPAWVVGEHATPGNVINIPAFQEHCRMVAQHYAGRIDCWEIWNEPYMNYFFKGSAEQFRDVCIAGAKGIKAGNPHAKTLGICSEICGTSFVASVGPEVWKHLDATSFHLYFSNITGNGGKTFAGELKALQKAMGPATPKEAWNTEGTLGDAGTNSFYRFLNVAPELNESAVAFSSRVWMESIKSGISKTFIYTMHQSDTVMFYGGLKMMVGFDRSVTPAAAAVATTAWCIDGLQLMPCPEILGVKQALFAGKDRCVWAVYDDEAVPGKRSLSRSTLPQTYRVLDTMGNNPFASDVCRVGIKPIFILSSPGDNEFLSNCQRALGDAEQK